MLTAMLSSLLLLIVPILARSHSTADTHITRHGSALYLGPNRWTASGANVYWLGLDENVQPPAGEPYDPKTKASYPTKARITEAFDTLVALGARTARSQTMGVSVGNPLSVMPNLGVVNEKAFESMDWAVKEARRTGVRIFAPFVSTPSPLHALRLNRKEIKWLSIR
jgi:mannan endo-1,4-beta-mannosidase